ncbi:MULTISPECIES: helix-turn-helix transcriptional regulator [Pseudomonas]|uniref:helix-turn-helix transcriptional regulator n=1 Tax=Pseudomonas TaxID=286 RepID=UPI0009F46F30|nr:MULTISPECIES: AlpA family phage regulatory protein [unclassified Pseudomonas]WLH89795.1 AlpA family phage regulatory protein [Pseudomonas sp. FP453]
MQRDSAVHPSVIRLKQLSVRVGLSRSTIYDRINPRSSRYDATFPKPFKLGSFAVGWLEEDVSAWLQRCVSVSYNGSNSSNHKH